MKMIFNRKLMISLLLVFLCGACKTGGTGSTAAGSAKSSFKPSSDAGKDLGDALRKLGAAFPYRLTETTTTSQAGQPAGDKTTRVVDFAATDRFHVKLSGGDEDDLELITIGEKSYTKENGKWSEEAAPKTGSPKIEFEKNIADAIKDVTLVGPETVNGVECFAYNYTIQLDKVTGKGKTWVRASDGLPQQSDSEFKNGDVGSKSHVGYEYNADVKVEPPM